MLMARLRYIFSIILMIGFSIFAFSAQNMQHAGKKQKVIIYDDTTMAMPDFKANFEVLRKNRVIYNAYNDSIFLIHDHDQWVNFFRRRALKNHQIFLANKIALSNIYDFFKQDTIPAYAYDKLLSAFYELYADKFSDPFITIDVCDILQNFYKECPDSLNISNAVNEWLAIAYMDVANLTNDSILSQKAVLCLKKGVSEKAKKYPYYERFYPLMLLNISKYTFLTKKALTIKEHNLYFSKLKEWWYQNHDAFPDNYNVKVIGSFIASHDEGLLRNVYMVDSTVMDKQVADSMMRKIVERNLANKKLSQLSFLRTLTMQVRLHQISASKAVKLALDRYKADWKNLKKMRLSSEQLTNYIVPFYSFFYLNDISDEGYSRKRSIVKKMCNDIELAYQHREDQQMKTVYVKYLNILTTYSRITKYLKPAERVHFLNALNVATQVTTYAHSVHVSMIAEQLMRGVLAYQPELLIGCLGDLQVSEISNNHKKYLDFIHDAAMYHDIGKNSIASVVNNDYRPITDMEYSIIKQHPEMGMQYLDLAPSLQKFKDTTLGHHKWYNGKGGYPASFDNTKSPKRILIDIVTLSDCLQAATERIGRNYKGDKNFDTVMAEFRKDAGTRYNPDLVNLIDEHPDLAQKLSDLIDDGWVEIYYNIYSQYFGK